MKKIPLRVWFALIMGLVLLLAAGSMIYRLYINKSFINAYGAEDYDTAREEKLLFANFPEGFVPYYNLGNAAYKKGDYNLAVSRFGSALTQHPTGDKDCLIRINLALSLCNTIDFYNLDTQEKVDTALFVLYKARDVLLENGCATEEGDGHNADAQQLKEDIDRMIERLKNPDQSNQGDQDQDLGDNNDSDDGSQGNNENPSDKEKRIQNELEKNKKGALEDRRDQQGDLDKWSDYIGGGGDDDGDSGFGSDIEVDPW